MTEMTRSLRILLIDDDADEPVLLGRMLRHAGTPFELEYASTYEEGFAALLRREHDICLIDQNLGAKTGLDLLRSCVEEEVRTPIILLTGQGTREIDVQAMESGAVDFLIKGSITPESLERAIRYGVERRKAEDSLRSALEQIEELNTTLESRVEELATILRGANCTIWRALVRCDAEEERLRWQLEPMDEDNAHQFVHLELRSDETYQDGWRRAMHPDDVARIDEHARDAIRSCAPGYTQEFRLIDRYKRTKWIHEDVSIAADGNDRWSLIGVCTDITPIKNAEVELRQREERHRAVLQALPDIIFQVDQNGEVVDFIPSSDFRTDIRAEDVVGKKVADLAPSASAASLLMRSIRNAADSQRIQTVEYPLSERGELHHHEGRVIPYVGRDVLLIVRDITERKSFEAQIVHERDRAQQYLDIARTILLALDERGRVTLINKQGIAALGYDEDRIQGRIWFDYFVPGRERMRLKDRFRRILDGESGLLDSYEHYVLTKDGEERLLQWSTTVIRDEDGVAVGTLSSGEDVTDRRKAEQAVRRGEERLRLITDSVPTLISYVDRDERFRFKNLAYEQWFNRPILEMHGLHIREVIGDENYQRAKPYIDRALNNETVVFESNIRHSDGTDRDLTVMYVPDCEANQGVVGFIVVVTDITEHRQSERRIRQMNLRLERRVEERTAELTEAVIEAERASKAKSEFLSRMSHELRTPLNSILGFAQLLDLDVEDDTAERESVDQILGAGRHLLSLIEEILDLSRIESGRMVLDEGRVPLEKLIRETAALTAPLRAQNSVTLYDYASEGNYVIDCDEKRMRQVLLNLMSNAIKYNRAHGTVTLTSDVRPNGRLRISVTDTGAGIPEEAQALLFEPFERLGAEETNVEGTGIGLVVSRSLTEAMRGTFGFTSRVGEGSCFWVEMPLSKSSDDDDSTELDAEAKSDAHVVLYIEHNLHNVALVRRALEKRTDIRLITAPQATVGINLAKTYHPDLILMDLNLPGMSGTDALKALKELPETMSIPVVALTARGMPADIENGLRAGFKRYLTKPIDLKEFLETVDAFLEDAPETPVSLRER
ncbi:MAG: PAS domain S-box protein [Candidatus Poribacteria bacterium]|nr:PAS domain S-box protein [Candidatus Poribacteria bacterium]